MQTDTVLACNIENNDHIVIDGEVVGYVYSIGEEAQGAVDWLIFDVVDDEGEHTMYPSSTFAMMEIVTSFLDEDSTDGSDVFIEL